jgi:ribonuclease-3
MSWAPEVIRRLARQFTGKHQGEIVPLQEVPREKLKALEKRLGYRIRNTNVFIQALQHRSFHQRSHHPARSNERMEFLGDSILNLIVGEYLFRLYPTAEEGDLTKIRSRLVNRKALATYARELHLSEFILMSPSAAQSGGKGHETITADTFEAIIAAIYLDGGFGAAKEFVERQILLALDHGAVAIHDENYKSRLLEYSQSHGYGIPRYVIVNEEGPDHDRTFTVDVLLSNSRQGSGKGKNKKEAEQAAASKALAHLIAHADPGQ